MERFAFDSKVLSFENSADQEERQTIAHLLFPAFEQRTLGVLTKLDMLDKGVDASEVLQGKIIKVKVGGYSLISNHDDLN